MKPRFLCCALALLLGCLFVPSCSGDSPVTTGSGDGGVTHVGDPCTKDADCANGEYCSASDDGMCGPIVRTCDTYPASCGEGVYRTICGCDGKSHAAGPCPGGTLQTDKRPGACPVAAGKFLCGDGACTVGTEYCTEGLTGVSCVALPVSCGGAQANCACLKTAGVPSCFCTDEVGGGVRVMECGV